METVGKKSVLDLINSVAADTQSKDEVTVLPLMCGTGKSTAISYKIRETIENAHSIGDGLLIVTDRVDRMENYLIPKDILLKQYIQEHHDQIVIVTHDNYEDALKAQYYKPVLMLTTQRFFRMTDAERESLLRWEKGRRPLVLIDERPELSTIVELNERTINECIIAVRNVFHREDRYIPTSELHEILMCYQEFLKEMQIESLDRKESVYCFWSWFEKEKYYDQIATFNENYNSICERKNINTYAQRNQYEDVLTRIRALHQLMEKPALLYHWTPTEGVSIDAFFVYLNNYNVLKNLKAKCIVLDATADLSPEYKIDPFDIKECTEYRRKLSKLHIRIVDIPTNKTKMINEKEYRESAMEFVRLYYNEYIQRDIGDSKDKFALFTYKAVEESYKKEFGRDRVEHFGNIVGKNDFRAAKHIVQVGINRFPDAAYYLYYLAMRPIEHKNVDNMEMARDYSEVDYSADVFLGEDHIIQDNSNSLKEVVSFLQSKTVLEQSDFIKKHMNDHNSEVRELMDNIMLAEIEQNLFRGTIRNDETTEDYYFHLFINSNQYRTLIQRMKSRYGNLGADVEDDQTKVASAILVSKIMKRQNVDHARRFIEWHDKELQIGDVYTPKDIRAGIGMCNPANIKSYEQMLWNNPVLRLLMAEEKDPDKVRGSFVKRRNWNMQINHM